MHLHLPALRPRGATRCAVARAAVAPAVAMAAAVAAALGGCGSGLAAGPATSIPATSLPANGPAIPASGPTASGPAGPAAASLPATAPTRSPTPGPALSGRCHARGSAPAVEPDARCTPGATNPAVTQSDVATTICRSGWTATVRPPVSYTDRLKLAQMAAYGETGSPSAYEEDHLIPLELGGAPSDPSNLWPEPGHSPNPKDRVESAGRRAVCAGQLDLATAQRAIASDWVAFGRQLGVL